jgi:hypothetical protein
MSQRRVLEEKSQFLSCDNALKLYDIALAQGEKNKDKYLLFWKSW